jgi:S1-C subfamily serine protease
MNLLDLVIIVACISAVMGGYRLGFVARAASWVGLAAGLFLAARFLPNVIDAVGPNQDPRSKFLLAVAILLGGAFVGQALGLVAGTQLHRVIPLGPLRMVDRTVGSALGLFGVLVALWLLLPSMADVPGWPAREARQSTIARLVDRSLPPPPNTIQALRQLVGENNFPRVFEALQPAQNAGPPPMASPLSAVVEGQVAASTVKVTGNACGREQDGSGFAVLNGDLVITNAHVVAGEPPGQTWVRRDSDGRLLHAVVEVYDPNRDLAVLGVSGLGMPPLTLTTGSAGQSGAVFGHPGGVNNLVIAPAGVFQEVTAQGRDLYDTHTTRRDVFILAAALHPGDSGGALVNRSGTVIGVAFAIAPDRNDTAYALTSAEVQEVLGVPRGSEGVSTEACVTD